MMKPIFCFFFYALIVGNVFGQHKHSNNGIFIIEDVEPQPLLAQSIRISEALLFSGASLPATAIHNLKILQDLPYTQKTVEQIQEILDPFTLAFVEINPESRVKALPGNIKPVLIQEGWATFLIKVHNQANITAVLEIESPNSEPVLHRSTGGSKMAPENEISPGQLDNRFLEISLNRNPPLKPNLSGLNLEYAVIHIYTRAIGKREAQIGFNVGQGTQDIGFRNTLDILFDIKPAVKVYFDVKDEDSSPVMASFIISDNYERFNISENSYHPENYRQALARTPAYEKPLTHNLPDQYKLRGIYPLPAQRVATRDTYPDFFFQPQIYRQDGEYVFLTPGKYSITYGRGPEYKVQKKEIIIPVDTDSISLNFELKRWINMSDFGWHSYDHHIHGAGCSHYESPEEGVRPEHMWRQILGEDLNFGSVLTWAPGWYHQKQFFSGEKHPLSTEQNILRYDVEVSGFPSSHAGHLALLNLKNDNYPETSTITSWPSWTLPVLEWAKSQGAITGYTHSGRGLEPIEPVLELPNYITPKMDGIGANEYVMTVTHDVVDFYAIGNSSALNELNMWYHSLNSGFKTKISGETDFPCIMDDRVGMFRTYAMCDLSFSSLMTAIKSGSTYGSDGFTHIIDFKVNGVQIDENNELDVPNSSTLAVSVKIAAMLNEIQDEIGAVIASRSLDQAPYWHIERARINNTRKILVELIVNGYPVENKEIVADGTWNDLNFNYKIEKSSWLAVRVFPSAHSNPIFVTVDHQPIRVKKSAEWSLKAVDQCWLMKSKVIREEELDDAFSAYEHARETYNRIIMEANKIYDN